MNEKVSIIIPTYKRSQFLERAVESVLNQTYLNIEVVIVDDNEPDSRYRTETENKMLKYVSNNKIKYIKNKKNLGGALARNEGINNADGDYITFLDDDDIYLPSKIEVQLNFMLDKKLDLSFTDVRLHNSENVLVDYREHHYIQDNSSNEELLKRHLMHHLTPTATYMFTKKSIQRLAGFDNVQVGQEFMLMLKAIENLLKIGYIPNAHVVQYLHDGERISVGKNKLNKEKELYKLKKAYFKYLSRRQRKYVSFRHHAVMAVVGKRSKLKISTLNHLLIAVFISPIDCLNEFIKHFKKLTKYKN